MCRSRGVSLIELVVVITISGIIATVLGAIIVRPIQGYEAQVRRAQLVDAAEMAVRRLGRDIRQALPNSVRIVDSLGNTDNVSCTTAGTTCTIEMLNTLDGARYRFDPGTVPGGHPHPAGVPWTIYRLQVPGLDSNGFNIVGQFENFQPTLPFTSTTERLAIYNQSANGANSAYADAVLAAGPYVITNPDAPQNTRFTLQDDGGGDEWRITPSGNPNFNFRWASPYQRIYVVDTPVSYVCSAGPNGNITRYSSYPITAAQAATPVGATNTALLSTPVSACSFSYSPGTNQRAGLVTLDITVRDNASGEQVRLLYQAHVDNSP
ncbi:MAG: type II secretion system GspH family protein [Sulfuricaulis sp.]|nr:type II secretion system GspH family protein [Sulfuricaulis sp.]